MMCPRRFIWTTALIAVAYGLLPALAFAQDTAAVENTPRAIKNCLLILLDAFEGSHVAHFGYPRETTPNLDALAKHGVSFSNAYSQCSNTLGSTVSFMSGRYLPAARTSGGGYALPEDGRPLAELFAASGYATAAYSENPFIRPSVGLDRGFQEFQWYPVIQRKRDGEPFRKRDESVTQRLLADAADWITSNSESRGWLCYLHILRPHGPYYSPEPYGSRFRPKGAPVPAQDDDIRLTQKHTYRGYSPTEEETQLLIDVYDGGIAFVDHVVGEFLDRLRSSGALNDTLVVVYSDHGEAFMQHGMLGHNTTVYQEMIHVPFVFIPPRKSGWSPGVRQDVVELVDLYPTLADVFGLDGGDQLDGESLVPQLRGSSPEAPATVYSQSRTSDMIAVRRGRAKMIFTAGVDGVALQAWYDLDDDPGERFNLLLTEPPPTEALEFAQAEISRNYVAPAGELTGFDPEQEDQLRALGYVE